MGVLGFLLRGHRIFVLGVGGLVLHLRLGLRWGLLDLDRGAHLAGDDPIVQLADLLGRVLAPLAVFILRARQTQDFHRELVVGGEALDRLEQLGEALVLDRGGLAVLLLPARAAVDVERQPPDVEILREREFPGDRPLLAAVRLQGDGVANRLARGVRLLVRLQVGDLQEPHRLGDHHVHVDPLQLRVDELVLLEQEDDLSHLQRPEERDVAEAGKDVGAQQPPGEVRAPDGVLHPHRSLADAVDRGVDGLQQRGEHQEGHEVGRVGQVHRQVPDRIGGDVLDARGELDAPRLVGEGGPDGLQAVLEHRSYDLLPVHLREHEGDRTAVDGVDHPGLGQEEICRPREEELVPAGQQHVRLGVYVARGAHAP